VKLILNVNCSGGLVFEEIQRLNRRLKTLPDGIEIEKAPSFSTAEFLGT